MVLQASSLVDILPMLDQRENVLHKIICMNLFDWRFERRITRLSFFILVPSPREKVARSAG